MMAAIGALGGLGALCRGALTELHQMAPAWRHSETRHRNRSTPWWTEWWCRLDYTSQSGLNLTSRFEILMDPEGR